MKLWEGNVFTPVCQSFCSRGGGEVFQHAMDRDVCIPACNGVSASGSRGCTPLDRHPLSRHPPRQTHKSLGRHTTPETDTTTQTDTPPGQTPYPQTPPGQRHPPRQTPTPPRWPLKRAVRTLPECILVTLVSHYRHESRKM